MHGPATRLIRKQGSEYTIRNASGGGGRDTPDYSDDGTLTATIERRTQTPDTTTDSGGEDVMSDLELRAVYDSASTTIREQGAADYPSKLVHPDGQTYRVVATFPEDGGVTVITVERE